MPDKAKSAASGPAATRLAIFACDPSQNRLIPKQFLRPLPENTDPKQEARRLVKAEEVFCKEVEFVGFTKEHTFHHRRAVFQCLGEKTERSFEQDVSIVKINEVPTVTETRFRWEAKQLAEIIRGDGKIKNCKGVRFSRFKETTERKMP